MTPGARVQAAIEITQAILEGRPAETAILGWTRRARFAGSKDRAAIRDHVFDLLRCWDSAALAGGGSDARTRLIGLLRLQDKDLSLLFNGVGHAPAPLSDAETKAGDMAAAKAAWDLPEWLCEEFTKSLGEEAFEIAQTLRHRAAVFLRVNLLKGTRGQAKERLAQDGIESLAQALSPTALMVTAGMRKIQHSQAFASGLVELQDAASQAVVDALPLKSGQRVLDYCAGGGGKALAIAPHTHPAEVFCHDINPVRMTDLPIRAARAGARLRTVENPSSGFDLVLCDVPCSGSGSWRRSPEGKWRLSRQGFETTLKIQASILERCAALVAPGGVLAYATCSVLRQENQDQVARFLDQNPEWSGLSCQQFLPSEAGDGLFLSTFARVN